MTKYIELEGAKRIVDDIDTWASGWREYAKLQMDSLPAADVVTRDCYDRLLAENDELRKERPVRHGVPAPHYETWLNSDMEPVKTVRIGNECPFCGNTKIKNFCPNCGARMDLKDGD